MHDARVAARRLIATGDLWLPRPGEWEELRPRLVKSVRKLGRLRNLDVAAVLLSQRARGGMDARRALLKYVRERRRSERRRVSKWLTDARVKKMKAAVAGALGRETKRLDTGTPGPASLAPRLGRILELVERGDPIENPRRTHELRREIRLLRYAHETLASEYPPAVHQAARALFTRLQDAAGEWHDRDVLARLAARALKKKKVRFPLGEFRARIRSEQATLGEQFVKGLADLIRMKNVLLGESG